MNARGRRWPVGALAALAAGALVLVAIATADDLHERLDRLVRRGDYDLALALLSDRAEQGALERDLVWLRACLLTDPTAFFEAARRIQPANAGPDTLAQSVALAVSREHFARGEYATALGDLAAWAPEVRAARPGMLLATGLAAAALGQIATAQEALRAIPPDQDAFGPAQTLLAGLSLRGGRNDEAMAYADRALDVDYRRVGPQALYARAEALRALGRGADADAACQRILRDFPATSEAAWVRDARGDAAASAAPVATAASASAAIAETDMPPRRVDFAVQVGAFHDRALALRQAARLRDAVADLRIERDSSAVPPWYRVVAGRFATRHLAEEALARLRGRGVEGIILSPGQGQP